jgi:hypothetical protein
MDAITNDFGDVLLWSFWFFIWIAALMVWFRCLFDMFGDSTLSGWAKAGWAILLIFVPWLGALIYLIARSDSMRERAMAAAARQQAEQEQYIRQAVGTSGGSADEIARAKDLLDAGVINEAEFTALKTKALA